MNKTLVAVTLVATAAFARAESLTYAIDPTHTFVTFEADHLGLSTLRGRFNRKEGSLTLDKTARSGTADITIDAGSVDTGVPALDTRLKGKDLLDAAGFATARFTADRFSFAGDKVSEVSGTLTLRGTAQPVTLKASRFNCYISPLLKREICGGDFETRIARSDYGMPYGIEVGLPDVIRLLVQIEAIRQ